MKIDEKDKIELLDILKTRFEENMYRHEKVLWADVLERLDKNPEKLWPLYQMEKTGGEPDMVVMDLEKDEIYFYDCSVESPIGRRSLCYDEQALEDRKKNKPKGSAMGMAKEMGVDIISEEEYRKLQGIFPFDKKTSSWVKTPDSIRKLGGSIFCDNRYETVFTYHNGADSYYSSRGFRGVLKI